jgi:hypothetical protein
MGKERFLIFGTAGGLASSILAASAAAQPPVQPSGPAPQYAHEHVGPIRQALRHTAFVLKDNFIGYPETFVEPPPGFYVYESIGIMRAKADPHKFTLYQSDFLAGTNQLSPVGAGRMNLMATRLQGWMGPIVVEWSPDQPGLAESRRLAVVSMLQSTGIPIIPERVVIGPSPYPGMIGTDAVNNYTGMSSRYQQAIGSYSVTPTSGGGFGGGGTQ